MSHWQELKRNYNTPTLKTLFPESKIWHQHHHKMKTKQIILKENESSFNNNIIHNLSSHKLHYNEYLLLTKGLNFSPNTTSCQLKSNQKLITGKLKNTINKRIIALTNQNMNTNYTRHPFLNTKNWTPPNNNNTRIDDFINKIQPTQPSTQHNLDEPFQFNYTDAAIKSLQENKDIIIKKADKGGGICILDKQDYINRIRNEHLNNRNTYRSIDYDPTPHITYDTNTLIDYLHKKHHIDYITKQFLTPDNKPRTPIFYGMPKIHKTNTPLRPIVSGFNSPTDNLAKYLTHYLQPLTEILPSHIKDSKHFLQILETIDKIPNNAILVTADVTSLYTNIPHEDGIEAVSQHYAHWSHILPQHSPKTEVIKIILHFILKHSNFRFQDQHFIQNTGTSMGGRYAPPYANIFMGKIEDIIHQEWSHHIYIWKRFIDDIFFIFTGTMTELTRLIFFMNNIHDTIKFTFEHSTNTINFLDITINIKNDKIMTTIHRKPTDKMLLLHFQSNHSLHTKESIIYSQALRYNLIINTDTQLQTELYNLTRTLLARKYPLHIINRNILKTLKFSRHDLLHKTKKQNKKPHFLPYGIYEKDRKLKNKIDTHTGTF